jgi:CRISPR-associated protein Cas6
MYWQNETESQSFRVPDKVLDVSFRLSGRTLPVDHAHTLCSALIGALPWLADDDSAGVHAIHVAASGNGWMRPEDPATEVLQLSRRTRLTLRVSKPRVEDASRLEGQTLDVDGHLLRIGEPKVKRLSTAATQFARYVIGDEPEHEFVLRVAEALEAMDIPPRRLLCGRTHLVQTPRGLLHTRSVMAADLTPAQAVRLQEQGIGPARKLGCGLFIPHKGIDPVSSPED